MSCTEQREVIAALEEERKLGRAPYRFIVERTESFKTTCRTTVEPRDQRSQLDESLEGSAVWWNTPQYGYASVLSVVPEHSHLNLRFLSSAPPDPGSTIWVQKPDFLGDLIALWENEVLADRSMRWLEGIYEPGRPVHADVPGDTGFPFLRERQRQAFRLLQHSCAFLWGPPGTGKTTTLGCLLAGYIAQYPGKRVLIVSMTNTAVDQALVAVDKGLDGLSAQVSIVAGARERCRRIGVHFIPEHFLGREHLLPPVDPDLIRELSRLEACRPDPAVDNEAYALWQDAIRALREKLKQQALADFMSTQLHAMTATHAAADYHLLREMNYDLVAIDEASQVGLAHALVLAPLGRRALFAGDFRQLAPIAECDFPVAERWLRRSMFNLMKLKDPSTCILNEQNRMAEPICRVVSSMFYRNQLKVAEDCLINAEWQNARRLTDVPGIGSGPIHVKTIHQEGTPARPGWYRLDSLDFVCKTVRQLADRQPHDGILVVTPFRAQRYRIRKRLRELGLGDIAATTIHRAQGSEYHTVVFDPVRGSCTWMMSEDGLRLINVAISRAKARLVIALSRGDRNNPVLDLIADYARRG